METKHKKANKNKVKRGKKQQIQKQSWNQRKDEMKDKGEYDNRAKEPDNFNGNIKKYQQ